MTRDALTTDAAPPTVAVPAIAPGTLVAGRYRVEARLGAGGGGTVWRCVDQELDSVVALKIVGEADLERWRREVAMARRIAHRNVCRVHDLGETPELRYVTMELVEGKSLRAFIRPDLPAAEAIELIRQLVAGTAAIHTAGVVHRDLKPENVVVATDGRAVIVDFGIAREPRPPDGTRPGEAHASASAITKAIPMAGPQTVTNAGTVIGTPRYMSPEQAAGDTVDARTDVYAIGLVAHELLAGAMPELAGTTRHIAEVVGDRWPAAPAILRRCLALSPAERFADARALQVAIAPRKRRWPLVAGGVGIAAATAVTVALLGGGDGTPTAPPPTPYRLVQLTTTGEREWPDEAPTSIAVSPDGKRFAYTTGAGKLYAREVTGGSKTTWTMPKYFKPPGKRYGPRAVTHSLVGWFHDDSLAVVATTDEGSQLYRLRASGDHELLHAGARRMRAAVSAADRIAIAVAGEGIVALSPGAQPQPLVAVADDVLGLAWSPDGARLAYVAVATAGEATIRVARADGSQPVEVWRGRTLADVDPLLAWAASDRLAFSYQDPDSRISHLLGIAVTGGELESRQQWPDDQLGAGAAANGTVLFLKGPAPEAVLVRSAGSVRFARAHADATPGSRVAGWTTDGRIVLLEGPPARAQIVVATRLEPVSPFRGPWTTRAWPGTTAGDIPDSVAGDQLIVHRLDRDPRTISIEQISPTGERARLAQIDNDELANPVRCAGDRKAPCVLAQLDADGSARFTELDPTTRALGKVISVPLQPRDFAVSHDGRVLAIVDGTHRLTLIERATGARVPGPELDPSAALVSIGFEESGSLWASATGLEGRLFGFAHLSPPTAKRKAWSVSVSGDALRRFTRPTPLTVDDARHDGARLLQIGVVSRDFRLEIWRAEGI